MLQVFSLFRFFLLIFLHDQGIIKIMDIISWILMGISLHIHFMDPQINVEPDKIIIDLQMNALFTDEMIELAEEGLIFEFDFYASLLAYPHEGAEILFTKRQTISLSYDFYTEKYYLKQGSKETSYPKLAKALEEARILGPLIFKLDSSRYSSFSFYAEIMLADNKTALKELNISSSEFWQGHKPTVKIKF